MSGLRAILAARFGRAGATTGAPHVRDALCLGRVMGVVVVALVPCVAMALWNTGRQANLALAALGRAGAGGWRGAVLDALGVGVDPGSVLASALHGALWFGPCWLVALAAGLFWELVFARARRRPLQEGVGVTALLFALTLPPAVPIWQIALGMSFGIVVAKELFGGTGRNFVNPALAARAFIYFGYPRWHSGNAVWVAVDGFTSATPLTALSTAGGSIGMDAVTQEWSDAFLGTMPGCMGETSALACLLGAALLVLTGIASWRVMGGMLLGGLFTAWFFNRVGSDTNAMYVLPPHWHVVVGGFAFGMVFMATDPVTSAQTNPGRWAYGLLVGLFCVLIRVLNPDFPESVMIVILLGNVFAPLIDWFVIAAHGPLRRWWRRRRYAA